MLYISKFKVKEGKFKEFQDWVKANKETLVKQAQKIGWKYLGIFYYVLGTGAPADGCFLHEFSKYADIDTFRTAHDDPIEEKLSKELTAFLTSDSMHDQILRPIGEGLIYDFW